LCNAVALVSHVFVDVDIVISALIANVFVVVILAANATGNSMVCIVDVFVCFSIAGRDVRYWLGIGGLSDFRI
jgi:hypothetical protein